MKRFLVLMAVATLLIGPQVGHAADGWSDDLEQVMAAAKKSGKVIVIDFTGSDWCLFCIRQRTEVFGTKKFKTWAGKRAELMIADFPSKKTPISDKVRQQNAALKKKYAVAGFPTILFLNAEGKELGRMVGYTPDSGPDVWIKQAEKVLSK